MTDKKLLAKNLRHLLTLLKVNVTRKSLENALLKHPDYPGLEAISQTFRDFDVETLPIRIGKEKLQEIPYPALAHLDLDDSRFIVLETFKDNEITYFDSKWKRARKTVSEFSDALKWSGIVMLVEAGTRSGERDYDKKRKAESLARTGAYALYILLGILLLLPAFMIPITYLPVYGLKLLGGVLCFFLLQRQFGIASSFTNTLCKLSGQSSCDIVINSPASKLFGLISLSELGILYFSGGTLLLITSALTALPVLTTLRIVTLLVLPFTFFSIYYQGRVLKKWCVMCLGVMIVFWLELIALLPLSFAFSISFKTVYVTFFSFALPLVVWAMLRSRIMASFGMLNLEKKLYRFMRNGYVFQSLLHDRPPVDMGKFENEFRCGAEKGLVELTIVSKPLCTPCVLAHDIAEDLLDKFEEQLTVNYRFAIKAEDTAALDTRVMQHFTKLYLTEDKEKAFEALSDWFHQQDESYFGTWKARYPLSKPPDAARVDAIVQKHTDWCQRSNIAKTPTIFIDGRELPEEFSIYDLKFQLTALLESKTA